jgi:hypothetical protein
MRSPNKNKNTIALSCILIHQEATAVRGFHMLYFTVFILIIVQLSTSNVSSTHKNKLPTSMGDIN